MGLPHTRLRVRNRAIWRCLWLTAVAVTITSASGQESDGPPADAGLVPIVEDKPIGASPTKNNGTPSPPASDAAPGKRPANDESTDNNPSAESVPGRTFPTPLVSDEQAAERGWKRLTKEDHVWVDKKNKRVVVDGAVCHREGPLEMFACTPHTKEYESVVVLYSKAFVIHAALLAVGAEPGNPVQFAPTYVPARGTIIDIEVAWRDPLGVQQKMRAQEWVRQFSTKKAMPFDWVFAGSSFWIDEETKERHYRAEAGDLICVSNFSTAMLDLPVASSDSNDGLMFDAFTDHIPAEGTRLLLILRPRPAAAP